MHRITAVISLLLLILFVEVIAQKPSISYRVFIELKAGLHSEKNNLTDPGGQLTNNSHVSPTTGVNAGVYLNDGRSAIGLDYDVVTIGNSLTFTSVQSSYGAGRPFSRLTPNYQYQMPLLKTNKMTKLSLMGKIGPSITFTGSPVGSTGTVTTVFLDNNDDTAAYIFTLDKLNRNIFAGLTIGAGLIYTPIPRLRFAYSIYPSWNLSSNDVIIQDIQYQYFNNPNVYNARALSTGTTLTRHSISMGYAFGKTHTRKEEIEKTKQLYTPEEWEKRKRWSLVLHSSHTYPVIHLNDPAGYLTQTPVERFTYGAQVFYRIKPKWSIGTGFESVPFQLDARTPSQLGGNGTYVRNSIQVPMLAEYSLLNTKGKIKIEWLARGGLALGLQRKVVANRQIDFDLRIIEQPEFYAESETRDRPSTAFLAGLVGTRLNLHLSKNIFLTGYVQNQWGLTNNTFHRSRATYQVGNPQAPEHEAELTTKGSVFLPGFGVGFQL